MRKSRTRSVNKEKAKDRLKKRADFDRVFQQGKRASGSGMRIVFLPNTTGMNRFAVCPVKKYGRAVDRNRAKRVGREAVRAIRGNLREGYDIVCVLFPGSDTFEARRLQLTQLCEKANLFR